MIGYKKGIYLTQEDDVSYFKEAIITLEIPEDATVITPYDQRINHRNKLLVDGLTDAGYPVPEQFKKLAFSNKLRCSKAIVTRVEDRETGNDISYAISIYETIYGGGLSWSSQTESKGSAITTYKVGKEIVPDKFDTNLDEECTNGIHFFLNKEDAYAF